MSTTVHYKPLTPKTLARRIHERMAGFLYGLEELTPAQLLEFQQEFTRLEKKATQPIYLPLKKA